MSLSSSSSSSSSKYSVFEIVLTLVLAVALGVAFWGWTFVYDLAKPVLKIYGLSYLTAGFWILASVFVPYIIRKPGIALIASLMAAFVESLLTHWGMMSLLWGLVQGLGAEVIFASFRYKNWSLPILILSAIVASLFSYALDFYLYEYSSLTLRLNLIQLTSFVVSSIMFAGVLSYYLGKRLVKLGLLNQFLISKNLEINRNA
jgi:energy-coupling factor transport system substrate-specific component